MSNFFTLKVNNNGQNNTNLIFYGNGAGGSETGNANYSNQESAQQKELNELRDLLNNSSEIGSDSRKDENTGYNFDFFG